MKLLYIGLRIEQVNSGAAQINQRNQEILISIFKSGFEFIEPITDKGILSKYQWGNNRNFIKELCSRIEKERYDYVFLAQSLYGIIAKIIKKKFPAVKIITFFHNIEVQYAREFIRTSGISHYPFFIATKYAEKKSVKYSDYYITLNIRDAQLLNKIYHKQSSLVLPTSFKDRFGLSEISCCKPKPDDIVYLFVGVAFFANIEGIRWFIKYVLPFVPGRLIIIGNGMDKYSNELLSDRIVVKGYVEDLSAYYRLATFVISPIFSGGGMKTKIAEALMYGKTILATNEALEGYVIDENAIYVCNDKNEFVKVIHQLISSSDLDNFNFYSRELYRKYYSFESSFSSLVNFFACI